MGTFFGANVVRQSIDPVVLKWLAQLPNEFFVFVGLQEGDFHVDFLVLKPSGIFNILSNALHVRRVHVERDWELADGRQVANPVRDAVEQCRRVTDYLLQQLDQFLEPESVDLVTDRRAAFKTFPVVVLSNPRSSASLPTHPFIKIIARQDRLLQHLTRFEWDQDMPADERRLHLSEKELTALARLWRLQCLDPVTLTPVGTRDAAVRPLSPAAAPADATPTAAEPPLDASRNPYQYTDSVVGSAFYGRTRELERIRRALLADPPQPVAIQGLQRTGKSSLAREAISRHVQQHGPCAVMRFDFRRLWQEGLKQQEDITLELLRQLLDEIPVSGNTTGLNIVAYRDAYRKIEAAGEVIDQRRLFRKVLADTRLRVKHTILFLDECQEIAAALGEPKHKTFFSLIESLCKDDPSGLRVVLAFRPRFFDLEPIKEINLGRLFEVLTLGPLDDAAAMRIIDRSDHLTWTTEAKQRVLFLSGAHPFWLQFVCHRLVERWILDRDRRIDTAFVDETFTEIVKDPGCRPQFHLLYQDVEKHDAAFELLRHLAEIVPNEGAPALISSLADRWQDTSLLRSALRPLVDNQIITVEDVPHAPALRFRVEALRRWMRPNLITL